MPPHGIAGKPAVNRLPRDGGIPSFPVLFAICRTLRGAQAKQLGDVKVEGPVVLGTSWGTTCCAVRPTVPFTGTGAGLSDRRGPASLTAISSLIGHGSGWKCRAWTPSKPFTSKTSRVRPSSGSPTLAEVQTETVEEIDSDGNQHLVGAGANGYNCSNFLW